MINKLRILMLFTAVSLLGFAGYSVLGKFEGGGAKNVKLHISQEGVDVEIQNFKVVHENLGRKEWELRAEQALVNNTNNVTKMRNVEFTFINAKDREVRVWADSGVLKNQTNDLDLEGHVKMVIESSIIEERMKPDRAPSSQPKS